jgi:hypothetical protein
MNIDRARQLKVGDIVHFPADRGDHAGYGRVSYVNVDAEINKSFYGDYYIWVTVERNGKSAGVASCAD